MLKIRLTKTGSKNEKKFRIVVVAARTKRDGKFLEILGFWQPEKKVLGKGQRKFKIDKERYDYWLAHGAQPTKAVLKLLNTNGTGKS